MINEISEDYRNDLTLLLKGILKPREIVGGGYRNAKKVASGWLRKQIHNSENPKQKISHIEVSSSGKAFSSVENAQRSKVYQALVAGTFTSISDREYVTDFNVIPATIGDGYEVYVATEYRKAAS